MYGMLGHEQLLRLCRAWVNRSTCCKGGRLLGEGGAADTPVTAADGELCDRAGGRGGAEEGRPPVVWPTATPDGHDGSPGGPPAPPPHPIRPAVPKGLAAATTAEAPAAGRRGCLPLPRMSPATGGGQGQGTCVVGGEGAASPPFPLRPPSFPAGRPTLATAARTTCRAVAEAAAPAAEVFAAAAATASGDYEGDSGDGGGGRRRQEGRAHHYVRRHTVHT